MARSLSLRVGEIEEGEALAVSVGSFNNSRVAPPATLCIADSVAIFCAGSQTRKLNGMLDIIL